MVITSGAPPPFDISTFIPKSPFIPPGLCDAERINPPSALYFFIIFEIAGVGATKSRPTTKTFLIPFATRIFIILPRTSFPGYLPSPPTTQLSSLSPLFFLTVIEACTKFSR